MVRFGADIALRDLLVALSSCERPAGLLEAMRCAVYGPRSRRPLANGVDLHGKFS